MTTLDPALERCLDGLPTVGEFDQAFLLITVNEGGIPEVCVLSRTELRPGVGDADLAAVIASRRARANLTRRPVATIVAVADDAVYVLTCNVVRRLDEADASAVVFAVADQRRDSVGVALRPLQFRVEERLRVDERWDRTERLLGMIADTSGNVA